MKPFYKVVNPGKIMCYLPRMGKDAPTNVFCKIELNERDRDREGLKLSISGVEGPLYNGNCLGSCGQIDMHLKPTSFVQFGPGWDAGKIAKFLEIWGQWHLNDMEAGSPRQRAFLRAKKAEIMKTDQLIQEAPHAYAIKAGFKDHYSMVCKWLDDAGLRIDNEYEHNGKPYKYGTAWLYEPLPEVVYDFLIGLPDTKLKPAWV